MKKFFKGLFQYLGESDLITMAVQPLISAALPQTRMGYEKRPTFLFLPNKEVFYDLPTITTPQSAVMKVELHEAKRAGTHLDLRLKINGRVHDFAVAKRDHLPSETGKVYRVIHRPNHSLKYFDTPSHTFEEGEYGYGEMSTVWKGEIDVLVSNPEKVEFYVPDGPFKGKYCIFTDQSPEFREGAVILRMKDPELPFKERMAFSANKNRVDKVYENPEEHVSEFKADGANYILYPGPKENVLISRRLSVEGQPINQADKIPWVKYHKFPQELYGKAIHVEVIVEDKSKWHGHGHHTHTAGLLNSSNLRARRMQLESNKPLRIMAWDIEAEGGYLERKALLEKVRVDAGPLDRRNWGYNQDRFWTVRQGHYKGLGLPWGNRALISQPHDNVQVCMTPKEWADFVKENGGEGVVIKRKDALYYQDVWYKDKVSMNLDVVIIGFQEGEGQFTGSLGAIIVEDPETLGRTRVGTGFTHEERQYIWDNRDQFEGRMMEISCHEVSDSGVCRGPRFERMRID